ncbi:MAG: hypothetical protein U9N77_16155 [Thermodesulfobacteriota bacterium]|nr:hypothetical protein [Thermodesulfobacteriota bacterium]
MNISGREKKALTIGLFFLLFFIVFQFILFPALEKKEKLKKIIIVKEDALKELFLLENQHSDLNQRERMDKQAVNKRNKHFTLFSFLDSLAEKSGVKDKVAYMKPFSRKSETGSINLSLVRVKIESLFLKELVDFLVMIENSGNGVYIKSLSLSKTGKEKKLLDAVIETETVI